ncbi:MAG: hypothetical protein NXI24_15935 [bacterium]|nr:hypothetical protein [bacterium]
MKFFYTALFLLGLNCDFNDSVKAKQESKQETITITTGGGRNIALAEELRNAFSEKRRDGKIVGYKILSLVRDRDCYERCGLRERDLMLTCNGVELQSTEEAVECFGSIIDACINNSPCPSLRVE